MIDIDPADLSPAAAHRLLVGIVVPRPIAWVSTLNESGSINLAPFSCYTFVSNHPPMIAVSCGRRNGVLKDTARNARKWGEFVVNVVTEDLVAPMHQSSREHPGETSEADLLDIALQASITVRPPRVSAAPIALECRLRQVLEFGNLKSEFLVGEVVRFRIAEDLIHDGKIDATQWRPLARLAGPHYARLGEVITMPDVGNAGPTGHPSNTSTRRHQLIPAHASRHPTGN
ncbi:MAG TPA: flavin reductase family protein [Stellaceae bacterium]|nr:flavin reductase family protein [Stellaceae bacterium]